MNVQFSLSTKYKKQPNPRARVRTQVQGSRVLPSDGSSDLARATSLDQLL